MDIILVISVNESKFIKNCDLKKLKKGRGVDPA